MDSRLEGATYVLHFGVVPKAAYLAAEIGGHNDPTDEAFLDLEVPAIVSGSWGCWATANQDTDGDNSLHVAVYWKRDREPDALDLGIIRNALSARLHEESRLLDYGVISTGNDWSQDQAVFLRDGGTFYLAVPNA